MKKFVTIGITLICVLGIATLSYAATCNFTPRITLEEKKEILDEKVEEGLITEQEADEIETKLENCDGTRQEKIGQEYGVCFGKGEEVCQNRENCENYEERNKNGKNQEERQTKGKGKGNGVCDGTGNGTGICKRISE